MSTRVSARARDDLDYIFACICTREGLTAADTFLERAAQAVELLDRHPEAGPHPGWVTRHTALRFWVISRTNFLIFYFVDEYGTSIERVLDGRRDVRRIVEEGLEDPR